MKPWAEVTVEGETVGTTPLKALELPPGRYSVVFAHPAFQPLRRKVEIRPGETTRVEVDLTWEGVAKPRS